MKTAQIFGTVFCLIFVADTITAQQRLGQQNSAQSIPGCLLEDRFFEDEVWAKVGERTCLRCHNEKGEAAESAFRLLKPDLTASTESTWLAQNKTAFETIARSAEGDDSRLLLKATGQLDHGGGEVLKADSTGLKILQRFVRRLNQQDTLQPEDDISKESAAALFEDLTMLPPDRRLRRITLSLAGRLPTTAELDEVRQNGDAAVATILERAFQEDAFHERLKEGFNDLFLTIGIEDKALVSALGLQQPAGTYSRGLAPSCRYRGSSVQQAVSSVGASRRGPSGTLGWTILNGLSDSGPC